MVYGKLVNVSKDVVSFKNKNGKVITLSPGESFIIGRLLVEDILFFKKLKEKKLLLKKSLNPFKEAIQFVEPIIEVEVIEPLVDEEIEYIAEVEENPDKGLLENLNEPLLDYSNITKNQIIDRLKEKGILSKEYESKRDLYNKLFVGK